MSYRDVPYLILILLTNPFDLMKSHFAVELIVFELYGQTSVPFFLPTLYIIKNYRTYYLLQDIILSKRPVTLV